MGADFSIIGVILMVAIFALVVVGKASLLTSVFFVAPLFDVDVISLDGVRLTPFFLLGAILILHRIALFILCQKLYVSRGVASYSILLFVFVAAISLLIPIINQGDIDVIPISGTFQDIENTTPLVLSVQNFSHFLKLFFVSMLFFVLVHEITVSSKDYFYYIQWLIYGSLFVLMSGFLLQLSIYVYGANVADMFSLLFHSVHNGDEILARVINYNSFEGYPRMYSLAGEPSFTSNLFIFAMSILISCKYSSKSDMCSYHVFKYRYIYLGLFFVGAIFTGSTTAYLGIFLMILVYVLFVAMGLFPAFRFSIRKNALLMIFLSVLCVIGMVLIYYEQIYSYILHEHLSKITDNTGSGSIRMRSILFGINVFFESPILGAGIGSNRSASLIVAILSNLGLVGVLLFLLFLISMIAKSRRIKFQMKEISDGIMMTNALAYTIFVWSLLSLIAIPILAITFGWFWVSSALLVSYDLKSKQDLNANGMHVK